jgi:hypothetical protein
MAGNGFSRSLLATALVTLGGATPDDTVRPDAQGPEVVTFQIAAADAEALLGYLVQRLEGQAPLRLGNRDAPTHRIDERRELVFFDDASTSLLDTGREVRFERLLSTEAGRKDNALTARVGSLRLSFREGLDLAAASRAESELALEELVEKDARKAMAASFATHDLDLTRLCESMRLEIKSVGIGLGDENGDLLKFTMRRVSCREADLEQRWHELRAEAAAGDAPHEAAARELRDAVLAEIAAARPKLLRVGNEDYQRSFARLQSATWLPLRTLHAFGISPLAAKVVALLTASVCFATLSAALAIHRLRRARAASAR